MKSWIILIALAVALTAAATLGLAFLPGDATDAGPGLSAPVAEGPAPSVEVEGDLSYKFGTMTQDEEAQHSWIFRNTGQGDLVLKNLGTDCSCTIAQFGPAKPAPGSEEKVLALKPNGSEAIVVKWKTNNKNDGPYRKSARIGTNDPKQAVITLSVEGEVHPAIVLVPGEQTINFQVVSNDEPSVRKVGLLSVDRPDVKVTGATSSNPALIGVEARPMTPDEAASMKAPKGHVIEVTLKMGTSLGPVAEEVVIQTDHPRAPEFRLSVLGRVAGPITLTPDKVFLREVSSRSGAAADLVLWVRGRSSAKFEVARKPPGLDVAIEPVSQPEGTKGSKYRMTVKVVPGTPAGPIRDEIILKTDHPQAAEIKVPVDVLVQGGS